MANKILSLAALLTFFAGAATAQTAAEAWKTLYPQVEKNIKAPTFRSKDYNIKDFGAVANDSATLNHPAINLAIATCSAEGGGRVVVPAGVWHTGPIDLKSNVNLHISEGATLLFTTNLKHYPHRANALGRSRLLQLPSAHLRLWRIEYRHYGQGYG